MTGAIVLAVVACSGEGATGPEPKQLTEDYGCGYGFYVSDEEQSVGLFVEYTDFVGAENGVVVNGSLGDAWHADLRFGQDLFANWCDDVLEEGEPIPRVDESWTVEGEIEVLERPPANTCGPARAMVTGLVATSPGGDNWVLGDSEISNEFWGCFAG